MLSQEALTAMVGANTECALQSAAVDKYVEHLHHSAGTGLHKTHAWYSTYRAAVQRPKSAETKKCEAMGTGRGMARRHRLAVVAESRSAKRELACVGHTRRKAQLVLGGALGCRWSALGGRGMGECVQTTAHTTAMHWVRHSGQSLH